jgi:hypothetical protein
VDFELLLALASASLLILYPLMLGIILAEARRRYRDRRRRQAAEKAQALLMEWLSPAQLAQYESNGYFEVTGSHSGKRYRIRRRQQMNVDELNERGARVAMWCFRPEGYLPVGDIMLRNMVAHTSVRVAIFLSGAKANAVTPDRTRAPTAQCVLPVGASAARFLQTGI